MKALCLYINSLSESEYHDLLAGITGDDLGEAVWFTAVVDESCLVPGHCSIDNIITVNTKHVTANSLHRENIT